MMKQLLILIRAATWLGLGWAHAAALPDKKLDFLEYKLYTGHDKEVWVPLKKLYAKGKAKGHSTYSLKAGLLLSRLYYKQMNVSFANALLDTLGVQSSALSDTAQAYLFRYDLSKEYLSRNLVQKAASLKSGVSATDSMAQLWSALQRLSVYAKQGNTLKGNIVMKEINAFASWDSTFIMNYKVYRGTNDKWEYLYRYEVEKYTTILDYLLQAGDLNRADSVLRFAKYLVRMHLGKESEYYVQLCMQEAQSQSLKSYSNSAARAYFEAYTSHPGLETDFL